MPKLFQFIQPVLILVSHRPGADGKLFSNPLSIPHASVKVFHGHTSVNKLSDFLKDGKKFALLHCNGICMRRYFLRLVVVFFYFLHIVEKEVLIELAAFRKAYLGHHFNKRIIKRKHFAISRGRLQILFRAFIRPHKDY